MWSVLVLVACQGGSQGSAADSHNAPIATASQPVVSVPVPETTPLAGTLLASREARVAADSNGVVTAVYVEPGASVAAGQALIALDSRTSSLSAIAGEAQAAAQEAQLAAAVADCERTEQLSAAGLVSGAQADRAKAGCEAARAGLRAAKASADVARTTLGKTTVRAPFAGIVGERLVDVGDFVGAQAPVVTLYGAGPMRVAFSVSERLAGRVATGQRVTASASGVSATGAITSLSGALRAGTHDRLAEATLDETSGLLPGMFVRVDLELGVAPGLVVPKTAVRSAGSTHRVFIARDHHAVETLVRLGPDVGENIAITSGLAEGDAVVVNPPEGLTDGRALE